MQSKSRSAWKGIVGEAVGLSHRIARTTVSVLHRLRPAPLAQRLSRLRQLRPPVPSEWISGALDANRSSAPVITRRVRLWSGLSSALRLGPCLAAGRERYDGRLSVAGTRPRSLPLPDAGGAAARHMTSARDRREARNSDFRYPPRDAGGHSRGRPPRRASRRQAGPPSFSW